MNKVLFWDFHGTLIHPDKLWSKSIHRAIHSLWPGHPISLEQVSACQEHGSFPWDHPERDYQHLTDPPRWWTHMGGMFFRTCRRCGLNVSEANQVTPLVRELIMDPANFRLYEDAVATLERLAANGWRQIMLSNNFPELAELCETLGISSYFEEFVVSALVGYDKPRIEIFNIARKQAGNPDRCVMIGDNPAADYEGARMAGMESILVHRSYEKAELVCARLSDLVPMLCDSQ